MKLDINHYYKMRGWNVCVQNPSPSSQEIKAISERTLLGSNLNSTPEQDISTAEPTGKFSI